MLHAETESGAGHKPSVWWLGVAWRDTVSRGHGANAGPPPSHQTPQSHVVCSVEFMLKKRSTSPVVRSATDLRGEGGQRRGE